MNFSRWHSHFSEGNPEKTAFHRQKRLPIDRRSTPLRKRVAIIIEQGDYDLLGAPFIGNCRATTLFRPNFARHEDETPTFVYDLLELPRLAASTFLNYTECRTNKWLNFESLFLKRGSF